GSIGPDLATSWTVRPGNKVITLNLRHGVRFSDGSPFDARAVKMWLEWRIAHPDSSDAQMGPVRSGAGLGKYKVRLTLESPNPQIPLAFSGYYNTTWGWVTSPRALAVMNANPKSLLLSRNTFGAGPYVYDRADSIPGDHCTFVPNRFYYDP